MPPPPTGHTKLKPPAVTQINPRLSEEAQLNGAFNYNRILMDPPGTKLLIHETPQQRRTWELHCRERWYIGTAPLHYRCYLICVPEIRGEHTEKKYSFPPSTVSCLKRPPPTRPLTHRGALPTPSINPYRPHPLLVFTQLLLRSEEVVE